MSSDTPSTFARSERTKLARHPERGTYDRDSVYRILDEGLVCHLGFVDQGSPFVIPALYARLDETVYVHGSAASRAVRTLAQGHDACLTVTLLDGLVLARSAFNHSMNYRSVMIFGRAREVNDRQEKWRALEAMVEHVARGRWHDARQPTDREVAATLVVALALDEVSAKIRTGPPKDDRSDARWPAWAGEIPLRLVALAPVDDPQLATGTTPPTYATRYRRPGQDH